jgi:phosphatidate cytidylyltransferase
MRFPLGRFGALRVIASIGLGAPAILATLWGGWAFALLVGVFGALMAFEWNGIANPQSRVEAFALHLAGLVTVLILAETGEDFLALAAVGGAIALSAAWAWRRRHDLRWPALGALYVLLPAYCFVWLRESAVEPVQVVLWLFAVIWATDISAYVVGRTFGGPKLAPKLSPSKTWAGLAGAVGGAAIMAMAVGLLIDGPILILALLGGTLAVIGQLGDLTESAFKRRFGVKDSSHLIPGQGGVLDRVDGLIFAILALAGLALVRGGDVLFLGLQR